MSLAEFVEKWCHPDYPPEPVAAAELDLVERHFCFLFPETYRTQVLRIGLPSPTIDLLDSIVERELDIYDLTDFFAPSDIVDYTNAWRARGLSSELVAFANDCQGDLFCFEVAPEARNRPQSAVWWFDHEDGEIEEIAANFDDWIATLCAIEPWTKVVPFAKRPD